MVARRHILVNLMQRKHAKKFLLNYSKKHSQSRSFWKIFTKWICPKELVTWSEEACWFVRCWTWICQKPNKDLFEIIMCYVRNCMLSQLSQYSTAFPVQYSYPSTVQLSQYSTAIPLQYSYPIQVQLSQYCTAIPFKYSYPSTVQISKYRHSGTTLLHGWEPVGLV